MLAPVIGGAVAFAGIGLLELTKGRLSIFNMVMMGGFLGAVIGAPAAILIGWPVHLLLLKQRWTNPVVYMVLGAGIGVIALLVFGSAWRASGAD